MILVNSNGGHFKLGKFSFAWSNTDQAYDWSGFTCIGWGNHILEFGEIDAGNGIFLTKYNGRGDIEYIKTILEI